jgi:hypothetical protein
MAPEQFRRDHEPNSAFRHRARRQTPINASNSPNWILGREVASKAVMRPSREPFECGPRYHGTLLDQVKNLGLDRRGWDFMLKKPGLLGPHPGFIAVLIEVGSVDSAGRLIRIIGRVFERLKRQSIDKNTATASMNAGNGRGQPRSRGIRLCTELILKIGAGESVKKTLRRNKRFQSVNSHGNSNREVRDDELGQSQYSYAPNRHILSYAQKIGEFVP